jgi:hypothetical protein
VASSQVLLAAVVLTLATEAIAAPCSTRHLTRFEVFDSAALVAVATVSKAPKPMHSGDVELDIIEQLKGPPVAQALARENGSCTAGFYNVHVGKVSHSALVFVGADGHAVGYWSGVIPKPTSQMLDAMRAWRDAVASGSDRARAEALVAAIESSDTSVSDDAAYYLADEPALLLALDDKQLARIAARTGGHNAGPEIILTRRRSPLLSAVGAPLPADLTAILRLDYEDVHSAEDLARIIERDRSTSGDRRVAALERCERVHGKRLGRFSVYNHGRVTRAMWKAFAQACRNGTAAHIP